MILLDPKILTAIIRCDLSGSMREMDVRSKDLSSDNLRHLDTTYRTITTRFCAGLCDFIRERGIFMRQIIDPALCACGLYHSSNIPRQRELKIAKLIMEKIDANS